ncbi:MAG: hypothetical protein IKO41_04125 [Lachnospiraceae bacterium]|nr:hypothetical protein [Lachnospiraceae bacterium]
MPILAMLKDDFDKGIQSPFLPEFDKSKNDDLEYRCNRIAEFLCPKISVKSDGIGPKKIICENKNNNPNKLKYKINLLFNRLLAILGNPTVSMNSIKHHKGD